MPIFYNTSPPTPTSKNNITDIAVTHGIRDFLLNKNLAPVYPLISTALNGSPKIGEPVLDTIVGTGNIIQPFGLPLETEGIFRMDIAILPNKFKNTDGTAKNLSTVEYIQPTQGPWGNTDFPQGIQNYPETANNDITTYGLLGKTEKVGYRKKTTLKNLYLDSTKQIDVGDWITLNPMDITKQVKGYADTYGFLNLGDSGAVQAADIIGSVLNGQGLGLAKSGVITNFDLRASLAGRVLGSTGLINDTKLGLIGGQQLALALANNAAFNVQQNLLGTLNVQDNILSLVKNGTLAGFRPNYQITVASSDIGKVADYTARILGFTLPKSYLSDAGSVFLSESNAANIERANSMILNTGRGQVKALIANMNANLIGTTQNDNPDTTPFRSGYVPGFKDNRGRKAINPKTYAFGDADGLITDFITGNDVIPEISYNRSEMIKKYGFNDTTGFGGRESQTYSESNINNSGFFWSSGNGNNLNSPSEYDEYIGDKKSLLTKTQALFNSKGMKNIISVKGEMNITPNQIQTAVVGGGISRGSAVMSASKFDVNGIYNGKDNKAFNTYCRSWTPRLRYDSVVRQVRHRGLDGKGKVPYRNQMVGSILDQYGTPQIAPYFDPKNPNFKPTDPKKFMLSIENLAWADNFPDLIASEIGPGDLLSGKRGRIMWFPPYDISFNENASVSWESNNFIGRGEPIYTYNNTERSGTLNFKIIVDHPTYFNAFRGSKGPDDHYIASYFAGCVEPSESIADKLTVSELSEISKEPSVSQQITDTKQEVPPLITAYFPNDVNTVPILPSNYEDGKCNSTQIDYNTDPNGVECGGGTIAGSVSNDSWNDGFNFGFNGIAADGKKIEFGGGEYSGWSDTNLISGLNTFLVKDNLFENCTVIINGYASSQGTASANQDLAIQRATNMKNYLESVLPKGIIFKEPTGEVLSASECKNITGAPTDSMSCKKLRKVAISFQYTPKSKKENEPKPVIKQSTQKTLNSKITSRFYNEANFFEQLTDIDPFIFDSVREKIKYFHPAFHSTTPEGLNSRLTFLHQCTRQGPTLEEQGANNLAFGRAPVCILRIGDFYNTKIIMDSLAIDYEPLVWDLNPEGIGVQPMIANVSISFKFIGGSTLLSPINKLQNALSFNYYANTHVYDVRADYVAKTDQTNNKSTTTIEGDVTTVTALKPYNLVNGLTNISDSNSILSQEQSEAIKPIINEQEDANNSNGPATPPVAAISNDEKVMQININASTFGLSANYDGTKIVGHFGMFNDNLSKSYDAKLFISNGASGLVDVATFKIGSATDFTPPLQPGGGDYVSAKDGWKLAIQDIVVNDIVNFVVKIPELPSVAFWVKLAVASFDCPDQTVNIDDFLRIEEWNDILENPCQSCYPDPYTASKPYVLNGETCPFSGTP